MKQYVKDARPGFYIVQNDVLDKYGATIGPLGIAVYNALCRFASRSGTSFPSLQTISTLVGMSRPSVVKYLKILKDNGLIEIELRKTDAGDSDSNWYTIKDCIGGVVNDVNYLVNNVNHGSKGDLLGVVNDVNSNNTYLNKTQLPIQKSNVGSNKKDDAAKKKDSERGAAHKCWQENMSGTMTPIIGEQIDELVDEYGADALTRAITVAVNANARTMRFVKGVLRKEQSEMTTHTNGNSKNVAVQRMEGEDW